MCRTTWLQAETSSLPLYTICLWTWPEVCGHLHTLQLQPPGGVPKILWKQTPCCFAGSSQATASGAFGGDYFLRRIHPHLVLWWLIDAFDQKLYLHKVTSHQERLQFWQEARRVTARSVRRAETRADKMKRRSV